MCGRYYVDDETAREINKIIRLADEKVRKAASANIQLQAKNIHPTEAAPVLMVTNQELSCKLQRWGFPGYQGKQVIFNARSESALEKKMFRDSIEYRRIVIPATWFYEWNRNKEKNIFYSKEQPVLFMAGIYNRYQDEDRFVILTTEANASMKPVHDRMPLILEESEIIPWIFDGEKTKALLHKVPCLLERRSDFEQMSLF
ncbi:MAG: SOS response-associated peptidase [Lachnospiraceae bacterium]|nr:SOS response-associated peptidase [Lachnospiraceae bacterium]MDY4097889.1 SOS response-associated peptidase [Lachnospiraceae bacterium]